MEIKSLKGLLALGSALGGFTDIFLTVLIGQPVYLGGLIIGLAVGFTNWFSRVVDPDYKG